jgi:hypothetical protein
LALWPGEFINYIEIQWGKRSLSFFTLVLLFQSLPFGYHPFLSTYDYFLLPLLNAVNVILYVNLQLATTEKLFFDRGLHRKKKFRGFPLPSRDVTYQTLSRREYVSLIKSEVFPFPSWNSHRILLNQLVFLFTGMNFPGYSSSPGGNSSKIFDNSFVHLFPA